MPADSDNNSNDGKPCVAAASDIAAPTLLNVHASGGGFGIAAFEYIDQLSTLTDPDAIRSAFVAALGTLGISAFGLLEVAPDPESFGRSIIDDWESEGWKEHYIAERYSRYDPCVAEIVASREPFLWSEALARSRRDKIQRRIYHEAADFRLNEGICIPIHGPNHYRAFATLAGDQIDLSPGARAALHVMALYTHNRLVKLVRPTEPQTLHLTLRETDCLRWVANGKSDWEIGEILKISERTAHWYIECAKRKLGVATRIQAVVRAAAAGLIVLD